MAILKLTKDNFEKEVLKSKTPVIVDFWAEWCLPCRMLAPVFEDVSGEYAGRLKFAKLDSDKETEIAQRYGIMSIPTLIVFRNGEEAGRIVGAMQKEEMRKRIDGLLI